MQNSIEQAVRDLSAGKMIIVVDDENRENEGDLVVLAEYATAETISFMAHYGCGLICTPMESERLADLGLAQMAGTNSDRHGTAFAVSVDGRETSTGISAHDRSETIQWLIADESKPTDFRKPGHVFPLAARAGGVLVRRGHTEAAVDLARIAHELSEGNGVNAAVICEIMNENGTMARMDDLERFAAQYGFRIVSIADLVEYRLRHERTADRCAETTLPTKYGTFTIYGYKERYTGRENAALVMGNISGTEPVLCRIHSECLTGDAFGSLRCDCGEQLESAMKKIAHEGRGIIIYLRQEGRGIGLINKLKAYALQDRGYDTVDANTALGFPADMRAYHAGADMLKDLGIQAVRLITNNPDKIRGLEDAGILVRERIPAIVPINRMNASYLRTKKERMSHMLDAASNLQH